MLSAYLQFAGTIYIGPYQAQGIQNRIVLRNCILVRLTCLIGMQHDWTDGTKECTIQYNFIQ
jgi:hypothetical protein